MPVPAAQPAITAMMLVRDRARLLELAARSVLAQEGPGADLELVILDDGSVDETWSVASELAATDPRVVLLRNERSRGIPAARNQVLAAARGRYVAICDSDDLFAPGRFAAQRAVLDADAESAIAGVGTRLRTFTGDDPAAGTEPAWHWGLRDGRLPFAFPTGMFRVAALRAAGGFDESLPIAEDLELCYRLAAAGARFATVDEVLVDYRVHTGSITRGRALLRERSTLRAQVRGARHLRGRLSVRGWLVVGQSVLRTSLAAIGLRR